MSTARLLIAAGALAALACSAAAESPKPAKARYATRDQVRECVDRQADLRERRQSIEEGTAARDATRDRLAAEAARLLALKTSTDRTDAGAVASLRQAVDKFNADATALNKANLDAQSVVDAYNADSQATNQQCDALEARAADIDAVLKERTRARAVAQAASSSAN